MSTFVIVGAGLAGAKGAQALREQGFDGEIVLIGEEELPPYDRPPLSKSYLAGESPWDDALVHPPEWYATNRVDLRLGRRAIAVQPAQHTVQLDDGTAQRYDKLLLTTGSTPRRLAVPGADAYGVLYLRRKGDADAIRATFGAGKRLVIVGGGWIGLEVAANARQAGTDVTVLEAADLPLLATLGPELAPVFADLHREHGVDLRTGVQLTEIVVDSSGEARGVRLADGTDVDAGAVLIAVGARPETDLAEQAGLAVDNGVLVDASLRSSDADIFAAGDIARAVHPKLGQRVRVEHWANALNQPATAAAAMLGNAASYDLLPFFYTDQYDLGMEYVGHAPPGSYAQVVVRGELKTREFIAFWLDGGRRLLAGMNVNIWDVTDPIKALIDSRAVLDTDRLADVDVPLDSVTRG
jgi:3-phenylpropionate/trans-cinnamate dioxygenase ferredoxin reductase subunit